jgi:hypothetical protein
MHIYCSFLVLLLMCNANFLLQISEIKTADIPDTDLSSVGVVSYGDFAIEVIDPVSDYLELMEVCSEYYGAIPCFCFTNNLFVSDCRMCLTSNLSRICFLGLISGLPLSDSLCIFFLYLHFIVSVLLE